LITIPESRTLYLLTTNYSMIVVFFALQGFFGGGGMHTHGRIIWPSASRPRVAGDSHRLLLSPGGDLRWPGGAGPGILRHQLANLGFAIPMLIGTTVAARLGLHRDAAQP